MSDTDIQLALAEPFPTEVERTLVKSGTRLTYIPVSEVITRLNKVIGIGNWSSQIMFCERDKLDPDFVVAHVRIQAMIDGAIVTKDGIGGQKIKRTKNGDIVDLGDEMKGAASDALKKAAQQLGVALYLARTEEALSLEMPSETQQPSVSDESWTQLTGLLNAMGPAEKEAIKEWWSANYPGAGSPSQFTSTQQQIDAVIEQALIVSLGASVEE